MVVLFVVFQAYNNQKYFLQSIHQIISIYNKDFFNTTKIINYKS